MTPCTAATRTRVAADAIPAGRRRSRGIRVVVLLLLFSTYGCINIAAAVVGHRLGIPLDAKAVASKSPPDRIIAADLTSCRVSHERWHEIAVGDTQVCMWSTARVPSMSLR